MGILNKDQVEIMVQTCIKDNCKKQASYGTIEDNQAKYCGQHKLSRLSKQNEIKEWLIKNDYDIISYDKILNDGNCGKERPDFVFNSIHNTHKIVLEVDEFQHSSYAEECECIRMFNIGQTIGEPTIFIRYNPDKYKTFKKTYNPSFKKRMKILKQYLDCAINFKHKDIAKLGYLSFIRLYYDGWNKYHSYNFSTLQMFEK